MDQDKGSLSHLADAFKIEAQAEALHLQDGQDDIDDKRRKPLILIDRFQR